MVGGLKGICEICLMETASFTCKLCGAKVGMRCFDSINGTCVRCTRGRMLGQ